MLMTVLTLGRKEAEPPCPFRFYLQIEAVWKYHKLHSA